MQSNIIFTLPYLFILLAFPVRNSSDHLGVADWAIGNHQVRTERVLPGVLPPGTGSKPLQTGSALDFDDDDYVEVSDNSSLDFSSEITIETWIKAKGSSSGFEVIALKATPSSWNAGFGLYAEGRRLKFFSDGYLTSIFDTGYDLPSDTWMHVAVSYSASHIRVYIDGAEVYSSVSVGIGNTDFNLTIGNDPVDSFYGFNGEIDELRIWNTARTEAQINALKDCEISVPVSGLVGNYHFNEGVAGSDNTMPPVNTLPDDSGMGNEGTLNNFALTGATSNWVAPGGVISGTNCSIGISSILRQNPANAFTNQDAVTFRVTFPEDVQNLDATDFSLSGTAADDGTLGAPVAVGSGASVWDIPVTGLTSSNGTINLDIAPGNNLETLSGVPLGANPSIASEEEYTIDNVFAATQVSSIRRDDPLTATTNADMVTFRIDFAEGVTSVDATDFLLSGTATPQGVIDEVVDDPNTALYFVRISGIEESNGTLRLDFADTNDITDLAGNPLGGSPVIGTEEEYTIDNDPCTNGDFLLVTTDIVLDSASTTGLNTVDIRKYNTLETAMTLASSDPTVILQAEAMVRLVPPFHAQPGSGLIAKTSPCETHIQTLVAPLTDHQEQEVASPEIVLEQEKNLSVSVQVIPNPAVDQVRIQIQQQQVQSLTLHVFDQDGRLVRTLLDDILHRRGSFTYQWNASSLSPGIYYITLLAPAGKIIKRLVIVR